MGFNIKNHFFGQINSMIVGFLVALNAESTFALLENEWFYIILFLAIFNGYFFNKELIIKSKVINNRLLYTIVVLLVLILSTLLAIAIMIMEFILLILGKRYFGNVHYKDKDIPIKKLSFYFNDEDIKRKLDLYENNRRNRKVLVFGIIFAYLLFNLGLQYSLNYMSLEMFDAVNISCVILLITICLFMYSKSIIREQQLLEPILTEKCDSKTYCDIYEKIVLKYCNIRTISHYLNGLQANGDFNKIKLVLDNFRQYQKKGFYMIAELYFKDSYEEKLVLYNHLNKLCEKEYSRNKSRINKNKINTLKTMQLMDQEKYQDAVEMIDILDRNTLLDNINYHCCKGVCLYHLEDYIKAEKEFAYVIDNGNTLYAINIARKYLDEIALKTKK